MKKLILILCVSATMLACEKEGCIDNEAVNYNAEADVDDGTCTYEGNYSFWVSQGISSWLVNSYNVTNLYVFVNGTQIGTMDPAAWTVGPDCGGVDLTVTHDLGNFKSEELSFFVNDQNGTQQFSGSFFCSANNCVGMELKW